MDLKDRYSEIKSLYELVTRQKAELIESAKFVAIGTLASGMAHEINNPLAVIDGIQRRVLVMIKKGMDQEKLRELMGTMGLMVQRIAGITKGMLEYSREGAKDECIPVNLKDVMEKSLNMCHQRLDKCHIHVQMPEIVDFCVEVRPMQIAQILMHLINNSQDAILHANEKWIRIEVTADETRIYLSVMDSGPGIAPEIANRIMEPFFTTKPVGAGVGLGLSIAKGIAESHQGKLYLDTYAPHTRFVLELPKQQTRERTKMAVV